MRNRAELAFYLLITIVPLLFGDERLGLAWGLQSWWRGWHCWWAGGDLLMGGWWLCAGRVVTLYSDTADGRVATCSWAGGDFVLGEWWLCTGRVVTCWWAGGDLLIGGPVVTLCWAGGDFVLGEHCRWWGGGGGGGGEEGENNHICNHLSGILYLLGLSSARFIQRHIPPVLSKPSVTCNSLDRGRGGGVGGGGKSYFAWEDLSGLMILSMGRCELNFLTLIMDRWGWVIWYLKSTQSQRSWGTREGPIRMMGSGGE